MIDRLRRGAPWVSLFIITAAPVVAAEPVDRQAAEILKVSGVRGGLVVHLGCGDGRLTAALRGNDRYQVLGLDRDAGRVQDARENLLQRGLYGPVTIDHWTGRVPLVDELVNLLVVDTGVQVKRDELLRVLVPDGVALLRSATGWTKLVKPRSDRIDEWTHYLHDASGNAVAHDELVGPPRHLQWLGSPRWSRHHDRMASMSALVSGSGRIFFIIDEGSRVSIQLPPRWKLVGRDAFNGTILWKRDITTWHSHLWPLKSGPTQLARRLVTAGGRVYATLGLKAPLSVLDGATGETIRELKDSQATEEILVDRGTVFALVNDGPAALDAFNPQLNVGDQARVGREFAWNRLPRRIVAWDAVSGRKRWQITGRVAPLSLAVGPKRLYYHDGDQIVAVSRDDGQVAWKAAGPVRKKFTVNFGPRVVLYRDVVLFAGGDRTMRAIDSASGKLLWKAVHDQSAYQSPEDLLVAGGLVWSAPTTRTGDSGVFTGRDPRSGEIKKKFAPDVSTYWFHHRCHMAKATDRFLMPSRTGIEFVDHEDEHWDINHWVRGGCLYGVMPCNGLVYAPPHNCACYPEAKLSGLNVLAPASDSRSVPKPPADEARLTRGPAYESLEGVETVDPDPADWATYRHDMGRSGATARAVAGELKPAWRTKLTGRLSTVVVADGRLYVAQIDQHTLHALDAETGKRLWRFTAGGRIDSPPSINGPRVLFGSADGSIHCLRAADGVHAWSFQAAPDNRRLMAFEQLESVWPLHGSVLVRDGVVSAVAGRSTFLDGGLRLLRLDARTGYKLSETILNERNPETGKNIQDRVQVLNMAVGLPDVLSASGDRVFMRSQEFDSEGNRLNLGPHSPQSPLQGSVQRGKTAHLFAPMGFLDGTFFHRSYWVYGRSFAGGHSGYYQAGKYTPSGRLLVTDGTSVYGFGRKPQYYRWTTTIEHQLFATGIEPPEEARSAVDEQVARRNARRGTTAMIRVAKSPSLNPKGQPLAVEAWVRADRPQGVVVARGGPTHGFALVFRGGRPRFVVRVDGKVASVSAKKRAVGRWVHLAGTLTAEKELRLFIDGKRVAKGKAPGLITADPIQAMEIGADDAGAVGTYRSPSGFTGIIDEVRVYHGSVTDAEIAAHHARPIQTETANAKLVFQCDFDDKTARDRSGNNNHGTIAGATAVAGQRGGAMKFVGRPARVGGSFVKHRWNVDLPLLVRAMVKAGPTLFVAGPPDLVDEEESFRLLVNREGTIAAKLARQDAALAGSEGGMLRAISASDGKTTAEMKLKSLPVWDGLVAARGRLYMATIDGSVVCLGAGEE